MAKNTTIHRIQIEGTSDLIKLRKELDGYQKDLKKVKQETKDGMTSGQAKKYQELSSSIKSTRKELNQTEKSLKGMNTSSKKGIGFIGKMAGAFTVATLAAGAFQKISRAVSQAIVNGVETFRQYEFAMSKVKAISGATDLEFQKLEQSAQALGRSTFFTATEVANLQINFSKLGFTATETLNAQEAALLTATATGEDLARTATVIGSTLRGFGLDASQAGRVADVMAASFTSSALDIEKFQTAMTKVAPVAKILGLSLEDTTATLGVLTDSGIEASIAGTSLRNIFLKLGDPSSDLAKSIGFTVNSGEEMVAQFKRMAAEGVNVEKMLEIVDVRQVAAISTMIENVDVLERQIGALEGSAGAAQEMSDIVGDNLEGTMKRFNSALDGLSIVLTEKIAPILTNVISSFTRLFNLFSDNLAPQLTQAEVLMNTRAEFEKQIKVLKTATLSEDARRKAIVKINDEFKDYLPNLLTEKSTLEEIEAASKLVVDQMQTRLVAMAFEEEQREILLRKRVAAEGKANHEIAEIRGELKSQQLEALGDVNPDDLAMIQLMEENFQKVNDEVLANADGQIEALKEKYKIMAKELGIVFDDIISGSAGTETETETGTETTGGSPANTDADPVGDALKSGEFDLQESLLSLKQMFGDKEIETKADLNARLQEMQLIHLESMLEIEGLSAEQRMALEQKVADIKVKNREDDLAKTEESERTKSELIKANIDNSLRIGSSLGQIGEIMGKNSAAAKASIAITRAASVASAINGIIDAKAAITNQAAAGDPYSAFGRVALMAAAVAPLIASLVALKSGGDKFANGGLTNGGMFKGASHANGGVKFSVGGRVHEAEGGEAIINKRSTAMFKPMLSAMNQAGGGVKFANGGFLSTGEKFAMGGEVADVQQMISGAGVSTQVVMVESDVTRTQGRVSNIESQATF